jgi:hypothetical protein
MVGDFGPIVDVECVLRTKLFSNSYRYFCISVGALSQTLYSACTVSLLGMIRKDYISFSSFCLSF